MARRSASAHWKAAARGVRLKVRRRPYSGPSLARGNLADVPAQRDQRTWVIKASDGHGAYWTKGFARRRRLRGCRRQERAHVLSAQDAAKKLARGEDGSTDNVPITVDGALTTYNTDLEARVPIPNQRRWPRLHLSSGLLRAGGPCSRLPS